MMRGLKYLTALWTGILVYVFFSVNSGAMGFSAYRQLEAERDREIANITALQQINSNLKNMESAMLSDKDTLIAYAREQGFAFPDERFVRIVGSGTPLRVVSSPGQIASPAFPGHTSDRFIKIFSLCAALAVLFCMSAYDFLRFLKDR